MILKLEYGGGGAMEKKFNVARFVHYDFIGRKKVMFQFNSMKS